MQTDIRYLFKLNKQTLFSKSAITSQHLPEDRRNEINQLRSIDFRMHKKQLLKINFIVIH